jgi:hypothetical protein
VPVANEKVKTYTYKAVQLHVSRSLSPYPRKKHAQHVTSFTVRTSKEELVHNQIMEFFALKGGGWKTL